MEVTGDIYFFVLIWWRRLPYTASMKQNQIYHREHFGFIHRGARLLSGLFIFSSAFYISPAARADTIVLSDPLNYPDGLITNEYAFWNPSDSASVKSPIWEMDSGSFFASGGAGWTGVPDDVSPNAKSTNGNNSAIFRLNTKEADFGDVSVSFSVLNQGLSTSPSTPAVDWDGLHIWLRYQSEYNLYYASINRRDNTVVIKKKIPGGPSNGGTYYELSNYVPHAVPYNTWQQVTASVKTNSNGSVTINLYDGSTLLVTATDNGTIGGPPITGLGRVGIRGDNANLKFKNFVVTSLSGTTPPAVPSAPTGVTAAAGNAQATISWAAVSGATSYNLYWSNASGVTTVNGTKITGVTSPRTVTGLTNGTPAYFIVTAVNSAGEGSASAQVSATPVAPVVVPAAPASVTAVAGNAQAIVSWAAVSGATSYNLYWSKTSGVTRTNGTKITGVTSPRVVTGLTNGTPYYFIVTAVNIAGESAASVQVSATPKAVVVTVPSAPTGVSAVPGKSKIMISWDPVPGATSYNLYRSLASGVTKLSSDKISNVTSPFILTGIKNGTRTYVVVTAVNSAGESAESVEVSAVPARGLHFLGGPAEAADLNSFLVFPNPWRSDLNSGTPITFDALTPNSAVKIFTLAGASVITLKADSTFVTWDLTNSVGEKVASGLYVYFITNDNNEKKRGTLAVIR